MKTVFLYIIILVLPMQLISQDAGKRQNISEDNGEIRVDAVDTLGGEVMIRYDYDLTKTYQERTIDGIKVFARYHRGRLVEYGMVYLSEHEFGQAGQTIAYDSGYWKQ